MERSSSELPILIGQTGPLNGQRWAINGSVVIGRDQECDIVIPDRQVSRYHARLTLNADGVVLEDLSSKNGTFCNGVRMVEPEVLQDSDVIQIALVQHFVFLNSDATMPLGEISAQPGGQESRLYLDPLSRRVWVGDQEVLPPLSVPQFRLLLMLYNQPGSVISRQELVQTVWGDQESIGVSEQALDALIRRLRDRLAMLDPDHNYLVTVRGHGLRLDNPTAG
jgi:hypothetical protein